MLKQTIENIIETEKKAEQIINDALTDAKNMSENATLEAQKIRESAISSVRADRQKVVETANKEADESYNNIIALGNKQADEIISTTKTKKVIDLIKNKVLKKYG